MKNVLKYKAFIGSVSYSAEDEVFFGKLEGIDDLVSFEGKSVEALKSAFEEAVDDYLDLCKETGKQPLKSFKGSFNVRVQPITHRKAFLKATELGVSLNQLVEKALESYLTDQKKQWTSD
ncbi:type II toxin-antitoxin system HicB family antitoxin [Negadavirga shengliensis]|uniref:Type II toxin-antitoxin system HicB family antitoxin n=1 Tax=Negadavirga shengliensis TaxID=1389218 RepID=A0ABV9SWF7_9BACT